MSFQAVRQFVEDALTYFDGSDSLAIPPERFCQRHLNVYLIRVFPKQGLEFIGSLGIQLAPEVNPPEPLSTELQFRRQFPRLALQETL